MLKDILAPIPLDERRDVLNSHLQILHSFAEVDGIDLQARRIAQRKHTEQITDRAVDLEEEQSVDNDKEMTMDDEYEDSDGASTDSTDDASVSEGKIGARSRSTQSGGKTSMATRAAEIGNRFKAIDLGLTVAIDVGSVLQWRNRFRDRIMRARYIMMKNRVMQETSFDDDQIVQVTNILFTEMLGKPVLTRITSIIQHANGADEEGKDNLLGERAHNHATRGDVPQLCKIVFQEFESYCKLTAKRNVAVTAVLAATRQIQWYNSYNHLIEAVEKKDKEILKELARWDIKPRRGANHSTLVRDYFKKTLDMNKTSVGNEVSRACALSELVDEHGYGVLVLLPPSARRA
jgi:hypothetical protein